MALEPGKLTDLGGPASAGGQEWSRRVEQAHEAAITDSGTVCFLAEADSDVSASVVHVDWDAFPVQVETCLGSESDANRFLDWNASVGDLGRFHGHEEYLEWRTVRSPAGKIVRVELTTELPDYWRVMAAHRPTRLLQLVARFAGETAVDPKQVYGALDPFAPGVTPAQREGAFASMMLPRGSRPPRSPYNNGQRAICFMYSGINSLGAAVQLAAYAAFPFAKTVGGQSVPPTGRELINSTRQAAADCRNSDPTIVQNVAGVAFDRRKVVFDDPIGVYISNVRRSRILMPDGVTPVPEEWFVLDRGTPGVDDDTDPDRFQRLVLQVPPGSGLEVGDLVSFDSGEPLRSGAELVRLVTVNFLVRLSAPDAVDVDRIPVNVTTPGDCADNPRCRGVQSAFQEFEETQAEPDVDADVDPPIVSRSGRRR